MTTPSARKRTKIIATLGPASDRDDILRAMIDAGLNVVRINFSHAKHDALRESVARIRRVSAAAGVPVAILGDLRGPRIRVGEMMGGAVQLTAGSDLLITPVPCVGTPERVSVTFPLLAGDVEPGTVILLDDGNLLLSVLEVHGGANGEIVARCTRGGTLSSNRGLNLPGRRVNLPSLTDKDVADVDFAVAEEFDFLALSFVQSAGDVRGLQRLLAARGSDIPSSPRSRKRARSTTLRPSRKQPTA